MASDFEGRHSFCQVEGGTYFWQRQLKKDAKVILAGVSGINETKKFLGGLVASEIFAPTPPMNNEPSLTMFSTIHIFLLASKLKAFSL